MMNRNKSENHKVISLKKVNEINRDKTDFAQLNLDEQHATLQIEIERHKQQLVSLQKQKDKMLQDIKEAIHKEKEEWLETKEQEREQVKKVGFKVGYDEGQESATEQYTNLLAEANEIVQTAKKDYEQTIEKHEKAIVHLAVTVAKKIISEEIRDNQDHFTAIVRKAIDDLKDKSNISIYLHPYDYQFVIRQKEELEQMVEDGETISVYVDQHLNEGDCVIKHPFGQIDVGIDLQLQQIKSALEEKVTEN